MKPSHHPYFASSLTKLGASFTTAAGAPGSAVMGNRMPLHLAGLFSLTAITLFGTYSAQAVTRTWDGGAGNDNWSTTSNWDGTNVPATGDDLQFAGGSGAGPIMQSSYNINSITFNTGASPFTLTNSVGTMLTLQAGVTNNDNSTQTINITAITLGASQTWNAGSAGGSLVFGGTTLNLGANQTLTIGGTNSTSITNQITGTGTSGIIKNGGGTLTLNTGNSYTGLTDVQAGTLTLGANNIFADASTIKVSGGILSVNTRTDTVAGVQLTAGSITSSNGVLTSTTAFDLQAGSASAILGGSVGATKTTAGTVTLSGANTYTGTTSIGNGTLSAGNLVVTGGNSHLGNASSAVVLGDGANTGTLSYTGAAATFVRGFSVTAGGGGGKLTNTTANLLQMSTGGTAVGSGATMTFGASGAGGISINSTSVISGAGNVAVNSSGAGVVTFSATNTYTGQLTVQQGKLSISTINNANTNGVLGNSASAVVLGGASTAGTLQYTGGNATSDKSFDVAAGGGVVQVDAAATVLTLNGQINGGVLTKIGLGTLTLGGADDNIGLGVIANAGTVVLGKTSSGGVHATGGAGLTIGGATVRLGGIGGDQIYDGSTVTVNNGTLDFNGQSEAFNILSGSGGTILNNGGGASMLTINGVSGGTSYAGVIANNTSGGGTMALVKSGSGTQTLSGANTYTGATTIDGGTLILSGTNGAIASSSGVTINSGGTLTLNDQTANTSRIGNVTITLKGGTFGYVSTSGTHTETVGQLSINTGASGVDSSTSGTGVFASSILTFASLARTTGATVNFTDASGTMSAGNNDNNVRFTAAPTLVNSIVGGYATVNAAGWATYNSAGSNDSVESLGTYVTTATNGNTATNYTNDNLDVTTSQTPDAAITPNSIRFNNGTARILTLQGATNIITSGGVLVTAAATNGGTITGGTLRGASGTDLVVHQYSSGSFSINSTIGDNTSATGLTKSGTGALTLGGNNSYTGATTVNAGTLILSGGAAIANIGAVNMANVAGAALQLNASETIGSLSGGGAAGGNVTLGANTLTVGDVANTTFAGVISGSGGALTKQGSGMLTLNGLNTYTGDTIIKAGTLKLDSGGSLASTKIIVGDEGSTGAILDATGSGLIIASGQTLGGIGTIQGLTTVHGIIAPGNSSGVLNNLGNSDLQADSTFKMEIGGLAVGTGYDQLNVSGAVTLAGLLNVTMTSGYIPNNGDLFFVVANDGTDAISGKFSNANIDDTTLVTLGGRQWLISYTANFENFIPTFTGGNDVALMAVPEPHAALIGGIGVLFLLRRRRA